MTKLNPYLEVIIATLFFGFNGILAKSMNLPATSVAFFRIFIPAAFIAVYLLYKGKSLFAHFSKKMLIASSINAVRMLLFYISINLTYVSLATVVLYTWPIFVAIFAAVFLKENMRNKWPYFITAFIGVAIIYLQKAVQLTAQDILGLSIMIVSAAMYAVTVILYKSESKNLSAEQLVFYQNAIGGVLFLGIFLFQRPWPSIEQAGLGMVLGITIGIIGFFLFFSALKKIPSYKASALAYNEVLMAVIFSMAIFHEPFTWNIFIGGILILGSAYMVSNTKNTKI